MVFDTVLRSRADSLIEDVVWNKNLLLIMEVFKSKCLTRLESNLHVRMRLQIFCLPRETYGHVSKNKIEFALAALTKCFTYRFIG